MEQASICVKNKIHKQLKRFMITGASAVVIDTLVYFILVQFYITSLSKGLSFLSGTFVAYLLNKFWTFESQSRSLKEVYKFITLYTLTLGVNVGVNTLCLIILGSFKPIAFITATGVSTILNFIGQKWWVFRE